MATDFCKILKNPAHGGIFCLRTLLPLVPLLLTFTGVAQPKLEVADAKQNFGFVNKGDIVKVIYDITNKGNQPLIINDAEVSCSCTSVDFPVQPLPPGQTAKITVSFDTKTVYNRQDRVVYINSNDPRGPAKLRYKGVVLKK